MTSWSRWLSFACSSDPAVDPGGRIVAPPRSPAPLLNLKIRPRAQPYLEEDIVGTFIVDAPVRRPNSYRRILKLT